MLTSRLGYILSAVLTLIPVFAPLAEEDVLTTLPAIVVVVVGGDSNYYPFTYLDSDNNPKGFDLELINAIGKEMGFEVKYELGTWQNVLKSLEQGKIDTVPMFVSDDRRSRFDFISAHANRDHVLFGFLNMPFINSLDKINGLKIGVQRDSMAHEILRNSDINLNIIVFDEYIDVVESVESADVDYILVPRAQSIQFLKRSKLSNIGVKSAPLFSNDYAFAVSNNNDLQLLLNKGMSLIHENQEYDRIFDKFENELYPISRTTKVITASIVIVFICLLAGVIYRFKIVIKKNAIILNTEIKHKIEAEKKAFHLINYEQITDLPNRKYFLQLLYKRQQSDVSSSEITGVLYVRIVNLLHIYRVAGLDIGDELLQTIANDFQSKNELIVGIPATGRFAVILPSCNTFNELLSISRELINSVPTTYSINKISLEVSYETGLAYCSESADTPENLLRKAEISCSVAKDSDDMFVVYSVSFEPDERTLKLMADFKGALSDDQFILYYQPKFSFHSNALCGAETLVRWQHPELGFLPPGIFIPFLENTGQLKDLTSHLIMKVMKQTCVIKNPGIKLSVNVSAKDLINDQIIELIINLSNTFGNNIILEITETALARNPEILVQNITKVNECGIGISIDDYGTGYSSMQYLRDLEPVELKIDQSFIRNITTS